MIIISYEYEIIIRILRTKYIVENDNFVHLDGHGRIISVFFKKKNWINGYKWVFS